MSLTGRQTENSLCRASSTRQSGHTFSLIPNARRSLSGAAKTLVINVPEKAADTINSVVVLEINGKIDITSPPSISAKSEIFIDTLDVAVSSDRENVELHYTLDGSVPNVSSKLATGPVRLTATTTVTARCFRDGKPVSGASSAVFTKVTPAPATNVEGTVNGIQVLIL